MIRFLMRFGVLQVTLIAADVVVADDVHEAAWDGDFERVKSLIDATPDLIRKRDELKRIPLHAAARGGHPELVRYLLDLGSDVNCVAYNGFTPLHLTSSGEVARILITTGADLSPRSVGGTALQNAARGHKVEVVQAILDAGVPLDFASAIQLGCVDRINEIIDADPDVVRRTNGHPPLIDAASNGDLEVVKLLVERGAVVNDGIQTNLSSTWTALNASAMSGHMRVAEYLLSVGADPNIGGGKFGRTFLSWAIDACDLSFVKLLLDRGADPNPATSSRFEGSPLAAAVGGGKSDVTALLLSYGATFGDDQGASLVLSALMGEHVEVARTLLEGGASVDVFSAAALGEIEEVTTLLDADPTQLNAGDPMLGRSPLGWAAAFGHADLVQLLCSRGGDPNHCTNAAAIGSHLIRIPTESSNQSDFGETPLHVAVMRGGQAVVEILLGHGANVNVRGATFDGGPGDTPLHIAAANGLPELVQLLLDHGADMNARGSWGSTVLHDAVPHIEIMRLLVERGVEINALDDSGGTPIDRVRVEDVEAFDLLRSAGASLDIFQACEFGDLQRVTELVSADPSQATAATNDHRLRSALTIAASNGHRDIVKFLIDHGADMNQREAFGESVMGVAALGGHLGVVELLFDLGADIGGRYDRTPLCLAARSTNDTKEIAQLLIERGARIHAVSRSGGEPIHLAAGANNVAVLELLVEAGADVNAKGRGDFGSRPLHAAAWGGAVEATQFLLNHGADPLGENFRGETALDIAERDHRPDPFDDPDESAKRRRVAEVIRRFIASTESED